MHRTIGDSFGIVDGKNVYVGEVPGVSPPTQLRHEEMTAIQEEICNVITTEGYSLQAPTEAVSTMNQLNTAINHKITQEAIARSASDASINATISNLDGSEIANYSTVTGAKVEDALNTLKTAVEAEETRNDTQDGQITTLQNTTALYVPSGALKGDALIFDTADSLWKPGSIRTFQPRIQVDSLVKGFASSWNPTADFPITGVQVNLKGKYATAGDGGVPQGDTLFQTYTIPMASVPEWSVDAVYRGNSWHIRGRIVFILPVTISNGYLGYVTNIFQALQLYFTASKALWYGPISSTDYNGCGRTLAPYKRFTNTTDDVNYAGDQSGNFISSPYGVVSGNSIWIGDNNFWYDIFTNADARAMPGIFTPSKKYAISFDVVAPAFTNCFEYPT